MTQFILAISRYLFTGLIAFYTLFHFWGLKSSSERLQKSLCGVQTLVIGVFHIGAYLVLYYTSNELNYLIFCGFQVLVFAFISILTKILYPKCNRFLLNDMIFLMSIGMVILSRISYTKSVKQFAIATVSMGVGLLLPIIVKKFRFLAGLSGFYAVFGIGLLGVVWLFGAVTHGSKISYTIGDITFQPSEFVKIVYAFCLAAILQKEMKARRIIFAALVAFLHVIILVLSKDLGSALIFFAVFICVLFAATRKPGFLFLGIASAAGAAIAAFKLFTHVQTRFIAWSDPWTTIDKEGYQITQSLFAICSGKWFGMGLNQGSPSSIPYVAADFVFSAVAQELGVIFAICVILVYLACFLMVLKTVKAIHNRFYRMLGIGVGVTILFQVFLTIGGGTKLIPSTGVTLPLISYGGSSVMTTIFLFFILLGISMVAKEEEENGCTYGYEEEAKEQLSSQRNRQDVLLRGRNDVKYLFRFDEYGYAYDEWGNIFDEDGYPCNLEGERYARNVRPDLYSMPSTKLFLAYKAQEASAIEQKRQEEKISQAKYQNIDCSILSVVFSLLFLVMCGYIGHYVRQNTVDLVSNSYNPVQAIYMQQNYRGTIYSRDEDELAYTDVSDAGEERIYPYGSLFSHVVGYSTKGRSGIEDLTNSYLIQSNSSLNLKMEAEMENRKNPGDNVYTTLDLSVQEAAQKAIGMYNGAVILTNVKTGEIIAMYSNPGFDPNEIDTQWESLTSDSKSTVLLNRVTQGLYPPGSTFKICTALEYIKENPSTISSYQYNCTGKFTNSDGDAIRCYHGTQHGSVDFRKSFAKSCNSSFANMGATLDRGEFGETLEKLQFNSELPFELPYSKSSVSMNSATSNYDCMQTSIGQGTTLVTPLHLNMITCAIANDGVLVKPHLLTKIESADGNLIKQFGSEEFGELMSPTEANLLQGLMAAVVEEGTATKLRNTTYQAAGKTGSAEYNSLSDSHAWFTGFAPVDDPEVAVTIIVEGAGSGGDFAVPIAKRVLDAYFAD